MYRLIHDCVEACLIFLPGLWFESATRDTYVDTTIYLLPEINIIVIIKD